MMVFNQLDMFEVVEQCVPKGFEAIRGKGLERVDRFKSITSLSAVILVVDLKPFEVGGWISKPLKLKGGRTIHVRISSDIEMRFKDADWDLIELSIGTHDEKHFLCIGRKGGDPIPLEMIDYPALERVAYKAEATNKAQESLPSFRYCHFSSYEPFMMDEVFVPARGASEIRINTWDHVSLALTDLIKESMSQWVLSDLLYELKLVPLNDHYYRLDLKYSTIIGGRTVCFIKMTDAEVSPFIVKRESYTSGKAVRVAEKQKRTVGEELGMLRVVSADRIELPFTELVNYAQIKRMLEEGDGVYSNSGFDFIEGDAQEVMDILLSGGKTVKRRKQFKFFATKDDWAHRVCNAVDIEPGKRVAEFHAGHGAIADVVRSLGVEPIVNELWSENAEVLRGKGYVDVSELDFLEMKPEDIGGKVDVIVGNPPWQRGIDIDHFLHSLSFLAEGGSISMLISPSFKTLETKKAIAFRETLKELGASIEDVPSGSFDHTSMAGVHVVITDY